MAYNNLERKQGQAIPGPKRFSIGKFFAKDDSGATAIEYALIIAGIAVIVAAVFVLLV